MKSRAALILSFTVILTLAAGSTFGKYSGGTGESDDPYKIASATDMQALAGDTGDYGKAFVLTNDINLAGVTMNPVGNSTITFTGVFDGNNHIIRDIVINMPSDTYVGLFGWVGPGGQVKNLGVVGANFQGYTNVGGLAGVNYGDITSCYVIGSVGGSSVVGGLAGCSNGTITSCYATGSVSGGYYVGGLVGYNYGSGSITSCYASGSVSGTGYAGGLVGYNYGSGSMITSCYASGSVSGAGSYVGGLVGMNDSGTLTNCYASGSVSGTGDSTGGLVGMNYSGTVTTCYASGSVSGNNGVGGLAGRSDYGTLTDCFWDTETSGQGTSAGGTGKTTAQMQTLATFTDSGWDFVGETDNGTDDIWKIPFAGGYPILSWQKYLGFQVKKCSVTAGSKYNTVCDSISFSGILDADANDIIAADNIVVAVDSNDLADPCVMTFPINAATFKKGSYNYTIKGYPFKSTFKFSTKTGKFSLSAKNIDLTGLSCPVIVTIQVGGSSGSVSLDETIVNGPKKLISYQLMMGAENSLMADKVSFKRSTKPDANSLTVSGRFTTAGEPDYLSNPMVITVGSQTFTVPGNLFLSKNGVVTCKAAPSNEGPLALVTAKLDYVKCTYTISIKYASITQHGVVDFGIDCFGVNLDGLETINLN
jgi:hypothetical protein